MGRDGGVWSPASKSDPPPPLVSVCSRGAEAPGRTGGEERSGAPPTPTHLLPFQRPLTFLRLGRRFAAEMSFYESQQVLNMNRRAGSRPDLTSAGTYRYARSEILHGGGNGYDPYMDGYKTYTLTKSTGAMAGGPGSGIR